MLALGLAIGVAVGCVGTVAAIAGGLAWLVYGLERCEEDRA